MPQGQADGGAIAGGFQDERHRPLPVACRQLVERGDRFGGIKPDVGAVMATSGVPRQRQAGRHRRRRGQRLATAPRVGKVGPVLLTVQVLEPERRAGRRRSAAVPRPPGGGTRPTGSTADTACTLILVRHWKPEATLSPPASPRQDQADGITTGCALAMPYTSAENSTIASFCASASIA